MSHNHMHTAVGLLKRLIMCVIDPCFSVLPQGYLLICMRHVLQQAGRHNMLPCSMVMEVPKTTVSMCDVTCIILVPRSCWTQMLHHWGSSLQQLLSIHILLLHAVCAARNNADWHPWTMQLVQAMSTCCKDPSSTCL